MTEDRSASAEKIATLLEERGGTAQVVRVCRPDGEARLGILVTIDAAGRLIGHLPPLPEVHVLDDGSLPPDTPRDMPEDVAARCEVGLARAQVERAEDDLDVVTRRLPGPPEQRAEARARLVAAREDLLVAEAALIAEGYELRR